MYPAPIRVLLVNDDASIHDLVERLFGRASYLTDVMLVDAVPSLRESAFQDVVRGAVEDSESRSREFDLREARTPAL
jgi:hypothetical protein